MVSDKGGSNIGIEPGILIDIYRQMSRIHEVDKAIRAGLSSGRFQFASCYSNHSRRCALGAHVNNAFLGR